MRTIKEIKSSENINGVNVIKLDTFSDLRGEIWSIYSPEYSDVEYKLDKVTISKLGVLRGFHADSLNCKLITCLHGKFQLAIADARESSDTYGNTEVHVITDEDPTLVFIPKGCLNAHLSLSEKCIFHYKWSHGYVQPESQATVVWNDKTLDIEWMHNNPIISDRDRNGKRFETIKF